MIDKIQSTFSSVLITCIGNYSHLIVNENKNRYNVIIKINNNDRFVTIFNEVCYNIFPNQTEYKAIHIQSTLNKIFQDIIELCDHKLYELSIYNTINVKIEYIHPLPYKLFESRFIINKPKLEIWNDFINCIW